MKPVSSIVRNRETHFVRRDQTVREATQLMALHQIGAVPVVEEDRVAGIFTERDVMNRVVAEGRDPATVRVGEVMSTGLVVAEINESYEECLRKMKQANVRHLLVLNGGRLAGIVSLRDLLLVDVDEKDEAIKLLNAYIHYIPADLATREHKA